MSAVADVTRSVGVALVALALVSCSSPEARGERGEATFTCADEPAEAAAVGSLPGSGSPEVGNVKLPEGTAVAPGVGAEGGAGAAPVVWISDEPVTGTVRDALVERFEETGLWPVWLEGLDGQAERPWDVGEFTGGDTASIDAIDAQRWLRQAAENTRFDEFPKPIPEAVTVVQGCDASSVEVSEVPINGRLGLIPVTRGADAITAVGWLGPTNYVDDVAPYSSVLRSWEDRFGAQVVSIGFATLTVVLTRPPSDLAAIEQLANEIWIVCSDVVDQGLEPRALAAELARNPVIECWWD